MAAGVVGALIVGLPAFRLRGLFFQQVDDDRSLRCIEYGVGAWCAAQWFLLRLRNSPALSPIPGAVASGVAVLARFLGS